MNCKFKNNILKIRQHSLIWNEIVLNTKENYCHHSYSVQKCRQVGKCKCISEYTQYYEKFNTDMLTEGICVTLSRFTNFWTRRIWKANECISKFYHYYENFNIHVLTKEIRIAFKSLQLCDKTSKCIEYILQLKT